MAAVSMKRAGKVRDMAARAIVTWPSSSGCQCNNPTDRNSSEMVKAMTDKVRTQSEVVENHATRGAVTRTRHSDLLTPRELAFVGRWQGDAAAAMRATGVTQPATAGAKLLAIPRVKKALLAKQRAMIRSMAEETVRRLRENQPRGSEELFHETQT
jgi:hypothetical protein